MSLRVTRNALPQQPKNHEVSVLAMDASPAKLNHLITNCLENLELKFLRTIITQMRCGIPAGLQAVSADDVTGGQMLNDEMIAHGIKRVFVEPGRIGFFKSFPQFEVEHFITQGLGGPDLTQIAREAY
jgi:hypothetical protein